MAQEAVVASLETQLKTVNEVLEKASVTLEKASRRTTHDGNSDIRNSLCQPNAV